MPLGLDLGQEADGRHSVSRSRRWSAGPTTWTTARHVVTTRVKLLALNAVDDEPAPPARLPESPYHAP
jgi:hypothetical protein